MKFQGAIKISNYSKEYYKKNREQILKNQKRYYEKHKNEFKEYHKKRYENNKEKYLAYNKKYYKKNREKILKQCRDKKPRCEICGLNYSKNEISRVKNVCIYCKK